MLDAPTGRTQHRIPGWTAAVLAAPVAGCAQVERVPTAEPPPATPPQATPPAAPPATRVAPAAQQRGKISLYGNGFAGKPTASGETFDPQARTMAHRTLPFGTRVRVTNLENHKSVEVVVNDRGPFVPGRIADLSEGAARAIGMTADGVVDALLEVLEPLRGR